MKIFIVYFASILCVTDTVHSTIMRQEPFGSLCITVNSNISAACCRLKAPNPQAEGFINPVPRLRLPEKDLCLYM